MNSLHEQNHKRTSIPELLNPVANGSPPADLNGQYGAAPLNGMGNPSYAPQRVPAAGPYHNPVGAPSSSFSLRAAEWDQAGGNDGELGRREDGGEASSSCRYTTANPNGHHAHSPPHPAYQEPYHRSRPVGEPANYGIDISPWPAAHNAYGAQMLTTVYPDERAGVPVPSPLSASSSRSTRTTAAAANGADAVGPKSVYMHHGCFATRADRGSTKQTTFTRSTSSKRCMHKPKPSLPMVTFQSYLGIQTVWF